jgi:hypothetical protein
LDRSGPRIEAGQQSIIGATVKEIAHYDRARPITPFPRMHPGNRSVRLRDMAAIIGKVAAGYLADIFGRRLMFFLASISTALALPWIMHS